jgi:tRNA threonylcarbamoyladenosine biosynthesis protein TsaB
VIVLALDSRSAHGSAALWRDGRVVDLRPADPGRGFSAQLPELLLDLLDGHGLALSDVDVFAACTGPGSLTGLRVGLATIQGLALGTNRLVVGVSALESVAADAMLRCPDASSPGWVGAWLDAFRGEVFTALYRVYDRGRTWRERLVEVEAPAVARPDEPAARWAVATAGAPGVVSGDPAGRSALELALPGRARFHDAGLLAGAVAALAAERAADGEGVRPHALHPLYVRRPDAETARERRLASAGPQHAAVTPADRVEP